MSRVSAFWQQCNHDLPVPRIPGSLAFTSHGTIEDAYLRPAHTGEFVAVTTTMEDRLDSILGEALTNLQDSTRFAGHPARLREGLVFSIRSGLTPRANWHPVDLSDHDATCYSVLKNSGGGRLLVDSTWIAELISSRFPSLRVFVIDLELSLIDGGPPSELARLWHETLGPHPIPFDPHDRNDLIEKGRQHPDLARHIAKWEQMKREGSKWVTGE